MDRPERKALRLPDYDYSRAGAYFVTICTEKRRCAFGTIRRGDPCGRPPTELTLYGKIAEEMLRRVEDLYAVRFDHYVIMPNHVHLLCRVEDRRATARVAPTLGRIIGAYKSLTANGCREAGLPFSLWQRGFYEHVIRDSADYLRIWSYIDSNPFKWEEDQYYSAGS